MPMQSSSWVQFKSMQTPAAKLIVAVLHAPCPPPVPAASESHSKETEEPELKVKVESSHTKSPKQSTTCVSLTSKMKLLSVQVLPEDDGLDSEVALQYKSCCKITVESEQARRPRQRRLSTSSIVEFVHTRVPSQHTSFWQSISSAVKLKVELEQVSPSFADEQHTAPTFVILQISLQVSSPMHTMTCPADLKLNGSLDTFCEQVLSPSQRNSPAGNRSCACGKSFAGAINSHPTHTSLPMHSPRFRRVTSQPAFRALPAPAFKTSRSIRSAPKVWDRLCIACKNAAPSWRRSQDV
mmetsp:Transcript_27783/g.44729  ORF Transcript_27783/g.44729 Transcript_27783/m.44729 type:complete len:296 (-) Transcript_27783:209-1096(-)